jgi:hypothetical protein
MDLNEAHRALVSALAGLATEDVGVETSVRPDAVTVKVWSRSPLTYYHAWVELLGDGTVRLPEPDDGCTPPGSPKRVVATAATAEAAVDLVVAEASEAAEYVADRIASAGTPSSPAAQPAVAADDLREACSLWQGGRDVGSSPIRGTARALTGVGHYFQAPFITEYEQEARRSREVLGAGVTLLRGVNAAPQLDADGWNAAVDLPARGFAGRGIKAKPDEDPQIEKQLATGRIEMPLWGVSLSRMVADNFGTRFLFELVGEFPAVAAWVASDTRDDEEELITGGRYHVVSQEQHGETTHVRLRWIGASGDRVGSDDVLLDVLGALPGVWKSEVTRSALVSGEEELTVRFAGYGNWATVTRRPGSDDVRVVRYWTPEPDPNAKWNDEWTEYAAIQKASRRTAVRADVESIVAAVLAER